MARKKKDKIETGRTPEQAMKALRFKCKMLYDLQRLRIQAQGRITKKAKGGEIVLHELDKDAMRTNVQYFLEAEKAMLKDVTTHLGDVPFYVAVARDKERWKGIGPALWAVILSEVRIEIADTPSKLWAFAGLSVLPAYRCCQCQTVVAKTSGGYQHPRKQRDVECSYASKVIPEALVFASGQAQRPTKGEKLPYNSWLRSKLCGVMGGSILRSSRYFCAYCEAELKRKKVKKGEEHEHDSTLEEIEEVELEAGLAVEDEDEDGPEGARFLHPSGGGDDECPNFGRELRLGPHGPDNLLVEVHRVDSPWRKFYEDYKHRKESAGWGKTPGHRHRAAIRYMVKMILLEVWKEWRAFEGLEVRPPYQEEYLGHVHGGSVATGTEG